MNYYFANGTERRGPHSLEELLSFGLRPDALVWREGLSDWQRADSLPEWVGSIPVASLPTVEQTNPPSEPVVQALTYHSPETRGANGMAVASLVLGIVSI